MTVLLTGRFIVSMATSDPLLTAKATDPLRNKSHMKLSINENRSDVHVFWLVMPCCVVLDINLTDPTHKCVSLYKFYRLETDERFCCI